MKVFFLASALTIAMMFNANAVFADNTPTNEKMPPQVEKERPKLYDKDGNELKTPPKPGDKVYDKNSKEKQPLKNNHRKGPELNLTQEQKDKAAVIREESKKKLKPIRREIHNLQNEIWEIKEDDSLTCQEKKEKTKPLFEKVMELRQSADQIRQEDMSQFESLLTTKQKKTLTQFKKSHKQKNTKPQRGKLYYWSTCE